MEKHMSYSKRLLPIAALLMLQACGGGSGGAFSNSSMAGASSHSATASSMAAKSYSLQKMNTTTFGVVYTAPLTGVDSNATKYAASINLENKAESVVNGVLVTPREYTLSYTPGEGSVAKMSSHIDYRDTTTGHLISVLVDGVSCISMSAYHMPVSIKIGDAGVLSTLSCSNNDTQERNWQTEDAGNENIRIIFNETTKNASGTTLKIKYYAYTLNTNGNIVTFKATEIFPANSYNIIFGGLTSSSSMSASSLLTNSSATNSSSKSSAASSINNYNCDGRTYCSQMTSCVEAIYFLQHCPGVEMDGNNDGMPCEKQWCH